MVDFRGYNHWVCEQASVATLEAVLDLLAFHFVAEAEPRGSACRFIHICGQAQD